MRSVFILAAAVALAQTPEPNVSISGIVKDAATGQPLADYLVSTSVSATWSGDTIFTNANTRTVQSTTDGQGRYRLADLPPGAYRISVRSGKASFLNQLTRHITLAGRDLESVDFAVVVEGTISGRVLDENKEPVPDLRVYLVSREYYLGVLGYFVRGISQSRTDDRGEYQLTNVPAGHPFLLLTEKRELRIPVHSEAPLDPKLRRRTPMRTWYPNSPVKEGAAAIVLRPGEHRERMDIDLRKSQSYCVDGTLEGPRGPTALSFSVEPLAPSSGTSGSGGMYMSAPGAVTGLDGKFRICDLYPGSYRLSVEARNAQPPFFAAAPVTITDRDLHNVKAIASVGQPLEGEVVWDGEAPADPETAKVSILMQPLFRARNGGEQLDARVTIPGTFRFDALLLDDYTVRTTLNAPGLYIKDVTYAGRSVRHEPLHVGSAMAGAGLRVVVAGDAATLGARVTGKDGNPVSDMRILLMPAEFRTDGMLAATLVTGQTDQAGRYTSQPLPPGKYYVAATQDSIDPTPESIAKLWRSRDRFKEVELTPKTATQVTLEPVRLD